MIFIEKQKAYHNIRRLKFFVTKTGHEVKILVGGIFNGKIIGFCVQSIIQAIPSTLLFNSCS